MVEQRFPIKVNEAIEKVMEFAHQGQTEHIPIEQSYGRFLSESIIADHPVPYFDRSLYDGFAIRSKDTVSCSRTNPILLEIIGEIGAGSVFRESVAENQAIRIMTGAEIPSDCDAVVMFEHVYEQQIDGKNYIQLDRNSAAGQNISFTGEDIQKGEVLLDKGTFINPGTVALLATFGYKYVPVGKKPKVGVIATGSELLELDQPLKPGKIRNSNAYMIVSQIVRAGGEPIYFGQFSDDIETCYSQVKEALEGMDMLITTGGVSVGDYDQLPVIYEKLGAHVLFNKIAMRPGSVTTIAEKDGKLLFGLSGNPSACYVGFELYTRPVIRTFQHAAYPLLRKETVELGTGYPTANTFDRFVRSSLVVKEGKLLADPVGLDKSHAVKSLAGAACLIVLPGGTVGYHAGERVSVMMLEDQQGMPFNSEVNETRTIPNG
ncbi:gephyrin-like molybdotransferase Glp [Oceanobacillus massiliensis]|uniref:molybdopterin molybdotransferase MoeA n=1 Tax=Oceanobacillus massiliensis TaxID=1465765 RepID=UPI003017038D